MSIYENVTNNVDYEYALNLLKDLHDKDPQNWKSEFINKMSHQINNNLKSNLSDYNEPLLTEKRKFTVFPINYPLIWKEYKKQLASFWKAEEIDFSNDYDDFQLLTKDEQHFIEMILAFFAASDGIVNFNLGERFTREVKVTEALICYQYQMMMENIHGEVYSMMLENIVRDPQRKQHLFNAIETIPAVKMMADWAFAWIESEKSFAHRIVAFAIVEGIFFSGAFASIFWLKKYKNNKSSESGGKQFLHGLIQSNKFIARDEGMHTDFACLLYRYVNNKLSFNEIKQMIEEAVNIAQNFMTVSLPVRLIGMNSEHMCDYIEYVADRLLVSLNYQKMYNKQNPFSFMKTIGCTDKTSFIEIRPHEYQDAHVFNQKTELEISDDF